MRKIVTIPEFASYHLLKHWIPNVINAIEPDKIIVSSGLFPLGPENKGHIDADFRKKWCYGNTNAGFDFMETYELLNQFRHDVDIYHVTMNYASSDANKCFLGAISWFDESPAVGDIIFPLEPDCFHLEVNKKIIQDAVDRLKPGDGISTKWVDFLETQYYTEAINLQNPKYRRFAYCFDNMQNYQNAMSGFMSQNYDKLTKCDEFISYHYCWFQSEPYKQLRYDLIYRSDPQYWKDFDRGLDEIRLESEDYVNGVLYDDPAKRIIVRPSRHDVGRYAEFINIEHPEAIKNHPNFVK